MTFTPPPISPADAWVAEMGQLQMQLHASTFNTYIAGLQYESYDGETFTVSAPTQGQADYVQQKWRQSMATALAKMLKTPVVVRVVVRNVATLWFAADDDTPSVTPHDPHTEALTKRIRELEQTVKEKEKEIDLLQERLKARPPRSVAPPRDNCVMLDREHLKHEIFQQPSACRAYVALLYLLPHGAGKLKAETLNTALGYSVSKGWQPLHGLEAAGVIKRDHKHITLLHVIPQKVAVAASFGDQNLPPQQETQNPLEGDGDQNLLPQQENPQKVAVTARNADMIHEWNNIPFPETRSFIHEPLEKQAALLASLHARLRLNLGAYNFSNLFRNATIAQLEEWRDEAEARGNNPAGWFIAAVRRQGVLYADQL